MASLRFWGGAFMIMKKPLDFGSWGGLSLEALLQLDEPGVDPTILAQPGESGAKVCFRLGFKGATCRPEFNVRLDGADELLSIVGPEPVALGESVQLSATFDRSVARLYVNGREVAASPASGALARSRLPRLLGCQSEAGDDRGYLVARLFELRMFNTGRTHPEILKWLHRHLAPVEEPSCVGLWSTMDDPEDVGARIITPELSEDTPIWRYMTYPHFARILEKEELFFPLATLMEDPWEASFPAFMYDTEFWARWFTARKDILGAETDIAQAARGFVSQMKDMQDERDRYAISCWHENPEESEPFWRLYSDSAFGVAIRTTVGRLILSANPTDRVRVNVSRVSYLDYESDPWPLTDYFVPVLYKRSDFKHEREVRAFCYDHGPRPVFEGQSGVSIRVDLQILLEEVMVSPRAPAWFFDHVQSSIWKAGLGATAVRASKLYTGPSPTAPKADPVPRTVEWRNVLMLFNTQEAFEAWHISVKERFHFPRFGRGASHGGINLVAGFKDNAARPIPHPDKHDQRVLCWTSEELLSSELTSGKIVEVEDAVAFGWSEALIGPGNPKDIRVAG